VAALLRLKTVILFALLGGVALWVGVGKVRLYFANPKPRVSSCAELYRAGPPGDWLELSSCRVSLAEAAYKETGAGAIREAYLPARPPERGAELPVKLVLATRDPQLLALLTTLRERTRGVDMARTNVELAARDPKYAEFTKADPPAARLAEAEKALETFLAERGNELDAVRALRGLVDADESGSVRVRSALGSVNVAPDAVVLQQEAKPSLAWPLTLTIGGGLFCLVAAASLLGLGLAGRSRATAGLRT